jgi:uncharacterized protein YlxW (UPF0749 family)
VKAYRTGLDVLGADAAGAAKAAGAAASFSPWGAIFEAAAGIATQQIAQKQQRDADTATQRAANREQADQAFAAHQAQMAQTVKAVTNPPKKAPDASQQAKAKAEESARKKRIVMYTVIGAVGVTGAGIAAWAIFKRR